MYGRISYRFLDIDAKKLENGLFSHLPYCLTPLSVESIRISGWNLSRKN